MPRSLSDIMQSVMAEKGALNAVSDATFEPDAVDGKSYVRRYTGEMRYEDDLVIGIGEKDTFAFDGQEYPLTDLFHWLRAQVEQSDPFSEPETNGTLTIRVSWRPTNGEDGPYENSELDGLDPSTFTVVED